MFSIFECKEISINAPLKIHKNKLSKISKIRTQFRWSLLVLSFGTDFMTMELNSACAGIKNVKTTVCVINYPKFRFHGNH